MAFNIVTTVNFHALRLRGFVTYPAHIAYGISKRGHDVRLISSLDFKEYAQGRKFLPLVPGEVIHFRANVPRYSINSVSEKGFICVNSAEAVYNSMDKLHSQMLVQKSNIAIAPTYPEILASDTENFLEKLADIMDQNSWDSCVIKPNYASGNGSNVWKIDRHEVMDFDMRRIARVKTWTIQKCIKYDRIIRTILHGGKMVRECVTYDSPMPGGWKCTVCINPHMAHDPTPSDELVDFVENICRVIQADNPGIAYIDVFETQDGYVYGETNLNCTLEQHEQVTGFPVYQHKADYLISLIK